MSCSVCHREIRIAARGLCGACYQRWQKRGTTDYAERSRSFCHIDDCGKPVVSNGMCDLHRKRLERHGHTEQTRPDSWGAKHKHPLFNSWAYMRRHRSQHAVDSVWADDFLQFVADVGARPSPKHKLFAANDKLPIGPENYVWKRAVTERVEGEDERTYMNRAQKVYRAVRKEAFRGYWLKHRYGLSSKQYTEMASAQHHRCAICGNEENNVIRGNKITLAVDHCHRAGVVRALLCTGCNTGLGSFRDDPSLLRAAIAYLEKHALPETT